MRVASWNVNSVRARAEHVGVWLARERPEVLFLQEIKCEEPAFPREAFAALGYTAEVVGQKSYNGVAALARVPFTLAERSLPGLSEEDGAAARYVEIVAEGTRLAGLYLPNGNSGGEAGYAAKLRWMAALRAHLATLLARGEDLAVLGDFNVCPTGADLAPGTLGDDDALVRPETRAAFRSLIWLGLTDALRAATPEGPLWTFWDYQAGAWPRDQGLRIDHALLSPALAEKMTEARPDRAERGRERASDHAPIIVGW